MTNGREEFLRQAIELAVMNVRNATGGPFGALVVKDGEVISTGVNQVTATNDPTAHAEVVAIRAACKNLGVFQLQGCEVYTSCEPCPMCLGALYWAHVSAFYFAGDKDDAARAEFDDSFIYAELIKGVEQRTIPGYRMLPELGRKPFDEWIKAAGKVLY
jgi:guanine deaminase